MVLKCGKRAGGDCWGNSRTTCRGSVMPESKPDIGQIFHALGDPTRRAHSRQTVGRAAVGFAAGRSSRHHPDRGDAASADPGGERPGAYREDRQGSDVPHRTRRILMCWNNGSAIIGPPGSGGSTDLGDLLVEE